MTWTKSWTYFLILSTLLTEIWNCWFPEKNQQKSLGVRLRTKAEHLSVKKVLLKTNKNVKSPQLKNEQKTTTGCQLTWSYRPQLKKGLQKASTHYLNKDYHRNPSGTSNYFAFKHITTVLSVKCRRSEPMDGKWRQRMICDTRMSSMLTRSKDSGCWRCCPPVSSAYSLADLQAGSSEPGRFASLLSEAHFWNKSRNWFSLFLLLSCLSLYLLPIPLVTFVFEWRFLLLDEWLSLLLECLGGLSSVPNKQVTHTHTHLYKWDVVILKSIFSYWQM